MTREEALAVAVDGLQYLLDNDTEYVSAEVTGQWQDALSTLQSEGSYDLDDPDDFARLMRDVEGE